MHRLGLCGILLLLPSCGGRSDSNSFMIRISEVVPSGRDSDWIELYNPYDHPVDLSGYYLSDNPDSPDKWRFPQGTMIGARGSTGGPFLAVFAGDGDAEGLQVSFGLDADAGEAVVLTAPDGRTRIDHVAFPPLGADTAWVRDPMVAGAWTRTLVPTLEEDNLIVDVLPAVESVTRPYPYSPITIKARLRGDLGQQDGELLPVQLFYRVGRGPWQRKAMVAVPREDEEQARFFSYTISGEDLHPGTVVGYMIAALGARGFWFTTPYELGTVGAGNRFDPAVGPSEEDYTFTLQVANDFTLMLSEVMAGNQSYAGLDRDHQDRTPDWLELHNLGQNECPLSGMILTKDDGRPGGAPQWAAKTTLLADQSILIFADEDTQEEGPHLPFRLSRRGETIRLVRSVNTGFYEIDRLRFGPLERDKTAGRQGPDPELACGVLRAPTPSFPNSEEGREAWFVGQVPVWAEWGTSPNPLSGRPVTIVARVAWDSAWLKDKAPPEDIPQVLLDWDVGDAASSPDAVGDLQYVQVMDRVVASMGDPSWVSYSFRTELEPLAAGSVVRYAVEAVDRAGRSTWNAAGGVAASAGEAGRPHAFTIGFEPPRIRITEVGLDDGAHGADDGYFEYAVADGSGLVKVRRAFVELKNEGDATVSVEGMFLSIFAGSQKDEAERRSRAPRLTEQWQISGEAVAAGDSEGLVIDPGGYLVLWLDGGPPGAAGPPAGCPSILASYLGAAVRLNERLEKGNGTIDSFQFKPVAEWCLAGAFGRAPGVEEGTLMPPSPGAENPTPPRLFVNEVFVWGDAEQWIELYNAGGTAVPLDGLKLMNRNSPAAEIRPDASVEITGRGFAVIVLGGAGGRDGTCEISYEASSDDVFLLPSDESAFLDVVMYKQGALPPVDPADPLAIWPAPPAGKSLARVPDGEAANLAPCKPTPGASNAGCAGAIFIRGDCNENGEFDSSDDQFTNTDFLALQAVLWTEGARENLGCEDRCDINDDGLLNLSDYVFFLRNFFHLSPPSFPDPFPDPGPDPTPDSLRCE